MAKGYDQHKERLATIQGFGKALAKRASFACEWCGDKDDLRPYDLAPDQEPEEETLALLCANCRRIADGGRFEADEVRELTGAVWHPIERIAQGAARVLARVDEDWAREAIDDSGLDENFKRSLGR